MFLTLIFASLSLDQYFRLSKGLSYSLVFSTSYGKFEQNFWPNNYFSNLFNFVFSFINRKFIYVRNFVALNISSFGHT